MKNKKIILPLISVLAGSVLASCSAFEHAEEDEVIEIDSSKTLLKVAAIRSGVEDEWLQNIAAKFEQKYADYSFEEGKKGIQILVDGDKTAYNGDQLGTTIANDDHVVYCVENVKYNAFLNPTQLVMNLKDIVNIKASDNNPFYKDEKSILDRMDPQFKQAFVKTNGDIFMLPYYESFASFQYDKDVFNDIDRQNNKSFYLKRSDLVIQKDPNMAEYYADTQNSTVAPLFDEFDKNDPSFPLADIFCDKDEDPSHRNYGPDGIAGTFDDGLPQTFTEFDVLCKFMKDNGYNPILGNSTYNYYFADMLASVWANEEGIDNMNLNFSWQGQATDLVKIENNAVVKNGGKVVTETVNITKSNAAELHRQEGVLRSLEFAKIIANNAPNEDYAFTQAQSLLMRTKFNADKKFEFGLLCDGNWWENEEKSTFAEDANDPNNRLNRNFGFFTFPKSSSEKWDSTLGQQTFYNINSSTCFLNKNLDSKNKNVKEAAVAFFLYINSNEGMSAFTTNTSITRPFEYTITEEDQPKISTYGKEMMKLRSYFSDTTGKTKGYNNCSTYPMSDIVAADENAVHKYQWNYQIQGAEKDKAIPVDIMMKKGMSAESYFVDSYTFTKKLFEN